MTPLAAKNITAKSPAEYSEEASFDALYHELAKGIQSMKNGEIYTIDEAWEEIDKV